MADNTNETVGLTTGVVDLFKIPESPDNDFDLIDRELAVGSVDFMENRLDRQLRALSDIEDDFLSAEIPWQPLTIAEHIDSLMTDLVSGATKTSSPSFIGHMTSALPQFLLPLSKLMTALNQNVVKLETSGSFTAMERQVLAMLHNLTFQRSDQFYKEWIHNDHGALGVFCSGGTVANITALWNARNLTFGADGLFKGVGQDGMPAALKHYGYEDVAVVVSERGHYSLSKAVDVLGLGRQSLITVPVDSNHRISIHELEQTCHDLEKRRIKIIAMVGIAGTTETGSVDPLDEMGALASRLGIYFHVDAAWGGATLMSSKSRHLMQGIENADSVTIDAHKQMYVPMGAGIVLFKDPHTVNSVEHHANYILRRGSKDLGRHSLEGSRPGMAMLVNACLHIIGRSGYEELIDQSLQRAVDFAELIKAHDDFELISEPQLCLLTYRYVPKHLQIQLAQANAETRAALNERLNELTTEIQMQQCAAGRSFVSRTQLQPEQYQWLPITVFRVVLANPLTTTEILNDVLQEQLFIAESIIARLDDIQTVAL